jgi:hypothetical protein
MWLDTILNLPGRLLVKFITRPSGNYVQHSIHRTEQLAKVIRPCDILLVEGELWVSGAIKYLTQSTWSHAAMYVGDIIDSDQHRDDPKVLIEADLKEGVIGVPLSKYRELNTRICRPVGLSTEDKSKVINHMMRNLGNAYDLKNVWDLARYLFPTPPVPVRFRRKMIGLGSGDPTRAICSSLIAQAFQSVRYPILPEATGEEGEGVYRIRHSTLFAPRDFDLSPYFEVVKPTIELAEQYKSIRWEDRMESGG